MPAACVGVVGLRPRHGVLDASGVAPLAPSFDTAGPMAATVADVDRCWSALVTGARSPYADTMTGDNEPPPDRTRATLTRLGTAPDLPLRGVRVACLDRDSGEEVARLGAQIATLTLDVDKVLADFWPAFRFEAGRTHAPTFPTQRARYDPNVAAKLAAAVGTESGEYHASIAVLATHRSRLLAWLDAEEIDAIATPTLGCAVPRIDKPEPEYRDALGRFTAPFSALNLPALAIGDLQLVGRTEADVLSLGLTCEAAGIRPVPPRCA